MIKNLIFDFGNVVIRFDPNYMAYQVTDIEAERQLLAKTVFNPITFELTDRGYVPIEKHIAMVLPEVPDYLREKAVRLLTDWYMYLPIVDGMEQLLLDAKRVGYRLYLLSNINLHFGNNRDKVDVLNLFDGAVLSSDVHFIKPEPEIYEHLINKYDLNKQECLFIDDRKVNVEGAETVGIKGYLFENAEKLREYIGVD